LFQNYAHISLKQYHTNETLNRLYDFKLLVKTEQSTELEDDVFRRKQYQNLGEEKQTKGIKI